MKTILEFSLKQAFPPTRKVISDRFMKSNGWLTNGYLMIREALEPKFSRAYRYQDKDIPINKILDTAIEKLRSKDTVFYEKAEIMNDIRVGYDKSFTVKLKSENFKCWVNPKFLTYLLEGVKNFKHSIMVGKSNNDPILVVDDNKEIMGMVMLFRTSQDEED